MHDSERTDDPTADELKLPDASVADLEPVDDDAENVTGGLPPLLVPAVQKVREAAARMKP